MKDSEFIELLNLYLDHEISAADSARLEHEIRTDLDRRRIYRQYCRMQQACKLIASDFATDDVAPAEADRKVVPFEPAARSQRRPVWIGVTVAAACVALVAMMGRRTPDTPPLSGDTVAAAPTQASPSAPTEATEVARPVSKGGLVAVAGSADKAVVAGSTTLMGDPLFLTGSTQAEAVRAAAVRQADNQLAWLEAMQLAPLPDRPAASPSLTFSERLVIEGRALGQRPAPAHPRPSDQAEEMVTFRFVK